MTVATGLIGRIKLLSATAITTTSYTSSAKMNFWSGTIALLIKLTGGSDNVTITQQCSEDDTNWYDPVDSDGNALGKVYTGLTVSKYIQPSPVISKYIRYKLVPGANSTVELTAIFKE